VKNGSATVTIDEAGRITLPEEIREQAHLEPGMDVRVTVDRDGRLEIEPEPVEVKIVRKGLVSVAVPVKPVPPLTHEMVQRMIEYDREIRPGLVDDDEDDDRR
jgi:AbrB family looped-hinge helix DNA binding protein